MEKKEEKEENSVILCFDTSETLIGGMQNYFKCTTKENTTDSKREKATKKTNITLKILIQLASGYTETVQTIFIASHCIGAVI